MLTKALAPLIAVCFFAGALSGQAIWLGTTSTDWNTASNWSTAAVPTAATNVVIPASAVLPSLSTTATCLDLTISSGATLNGGAGTLNLEGSWINNGTFNAGTSIVNFFGGALNVTLGGTSTTTFYRLLIQKNARTVEVVQQAPVVVAYVNTSTATPALDIRNGTYRNGGQNLSVLNGVTGGTAPSTGELHVSGGTVALGIVYQFSQLKQFTITGGDVTISGEHSVVNSSHYFAMSGGTVTYTSTGSNVRLLSNNGTSGGWNITGGTATFHGNIASQTSNNTFTATGTSVVRFAGATNSLVYLADTPTVGPQNWNLANVIVEKTGAGKVTFTTNAANSSMTTSSATISALNVAAGAAAELAGNFQAGQGWNVGSVSNSGTLTWTHNDIRVSGNITSTAGSSMVGSPGSIVKLTGAAASTLSGNNTFDSLSCTQAGRTINFSASSTTTVAALFHMVGTQASPILLRSTSTGNVWNLNNTGGSYVRYVDVRDSNATNPVQNGPGGINSGNNTNWLFGGGLSVNATVAATLGVNANDAGPAGIGRQAGEILVENAGATPATLSSLSIKAWGSGNDATAYTGIALYVDNPAAGSIGAYDAADTLFGTAALTFPANDGTLVFTDTLALAATQTARVFVVTKLDGPTKPTVGQTFQFQVSVATAAGSVSGAPSLVMPGLVITAPVINRFFPVNPANVAKQVPPNYTGPAGNGFVLNLLGLENPGSAPVNVTTIVISHSGTGVVTPAASTAYTRFELYKDTNGNQIWDPADVKIGINTPVLPATFTVQAAEQLHPGFSLVYYFVVGAFNSPSLPASGATFNFSTSFTVTSTYPGATTGGTNFVRNGATINASATALLFARAAESQLQTATQTDTGPGGAGIQAGKFVVENIGAVAGSISSITVGLNSSAPTFLPRCYSEVLLYRDTNASGSYDAGDTQMGLAVLGTTFSATAVASQTASFTPAASISIASTAMETFFVVVKYNGNPLPVQGLTYRCFVSSISAVGGLAFGFSTDNMAGVFIVPNVLAVTATAGAPLDVFSNDQGPANQGIEAGKLSITANNAPGSELLSISIQASGSGDDSTAYLEVAVYRDGAVGAVGSYDNAGDTLIGTAAAFPGNDGTLLFNVAGAEQSFAASESRDYFVVVRLANTAIPGQTFQFRVVDIGVNLGKGGVPSAIMAGLTIKAPVFTIADNSLPQATAYAGQGGFVIQQFTVSYPAGPDNTLTDMTFTGVSATGNVQGDITPVELYRDDNANGVYDAGTDVLVHSVVSFGIGNQVQFTLPAAESQFTASATPRQYFVVVGFVVTTPNQSIFQTQLMGASGASQGSIINGTPAPAGGAAPGLEVLANNLLLTLNGPQTALTVGNLDQGPGDIGLVLWDGTIATISGAWTVNDITFTATGTANQLTAYSYVALWEDTNSNGAYDGAAGGDSLADPGPVGGFAGGAFTATLTNQAFPAQTARRFFVVVKLAGTATTGQTLNAELSSLNGTPPAGGQFTGDINVSSTALIIDVPSVSAFGAPGAPAVQTLKSGTVQTALVGKIRLAASNNDVDVTGLVLTGSGTGNWAADITTVEVWRDNGDGTFAAATDTMVFSGASGLTVNATFTAAVTVLNNDHRDLWLRVICSATAAAGASVPLTYTLGIASAGDIITTATPLLGAPAAQSSVLKIVDFFVNEFTPLADLLVGGKDIVIKGSGFEAPFQVRIGGTICPGTPVITATEVTGLTVPSGSGTGLAIEIDSGTLATQTLTDTFNYVIVTKPKVNGDGCVAGLGAPWLAAPALIAFFAMRRRRK